MKLLDDMNATSTMSNTSAPRRNVDMGYTRKAIETTQLQQKKDKQAATAVTCVLHAVSLLLIVGSVFFGRD